MLQLRGAGDECHSARREREDSGPDLVVTVLPVVGIGSSGSVRAAFINHG